MIGIGSNKLRIRPSESIKPEILDKRIFDVTKNASLSTFRCGLPQLKSMNNIAKRRSFRSGSHTYFAEFHSFGKFQIRNYLLLDQRKKQHLHKQVAEFLLFSNHMCYVSEIFISE